MDARKATKKCSRCGERKQPEEFHRLNSRTENRQSHCKLCDNKRKTEYMRARSLREGKKQRTLTLVARELREKGLKKCPGCKEVKSEDAFYRSRAAHDGLASHCIVCRTEIEKKYNKHPPLSREKKTKNRDKRLQLKFNISLEDYERMLVEQNGVCAICGGTDKGKGLAVDHNHKTGANRQLLCSRCNPAIGFLRDNPELARKIADYLEKHDDAYPSIPNLYKDQNIRLLRECYAVEKIHGTSARVAWQGGKVDYFPGGGSPVVFRGLFNEDKLASSFASLGHDTVVVYGEFYGGNQQGQSWRYGSVQRFVAFDVRIGVLWLAVPVAAEITKQLGLEFVHYAKVSTDLAVLDAERDAPSEQARRNGVEGDQPREGVVLRPLIEMRTNNGERVIAKHKRDDERETKKPREVVDPAKLEVLTKANEIAEEWVTPTRLQHVLDKLPQGIGIEKTGDVIRAMVEDVLREGAGEFVDSKEARKAIGTKASELFKAKIKADAFAKGPA